MAIDEKAIAELLKSYKGPEDMVGENGLLKRITKGVLEAAMKTEITEHPGYEKRPRKRQLPERENDEDAEGRVRRDRTGHAAGSQRGVRTEAGA
jgi:transposase-like protein